MIETETMPVGLLVRGGAAERPQRTRLQGEYTTIEPLNSAQHADALWMATGGAGNTALWAYMHGGPFIDCPAFDAWLRKSAASEDPLFFAIMSHESGKAAGIAAYLRIDPDQRVIEVGSIVYSRELQMTRAATEAMYLMARHAFENLNYRRYEWKCNALNEASKSAALRLGFTFEGVFRQHMIVKGRNRDTAWFSMIDSEWPARKAEFERWLAPDNFDRNGLQKTRLSNRPSA